MRSRASASASARAISRRASSSSRRARRLSSIEGAALLGEIVDDRALLARRRLGRLELAEEVEDERGGTLARGGGGGGGALSPSTGFPAARGRASGVARGDARDAPRHASSEGTSRTIIRLPMPSVHTGVSGPISPSPNALEVCRASPPSARGAARGRGVEGARGQHLRKTQQRTTARLARATTRRRTGRSSP